MVSILAIPDIRDEVCLLINGIKGGRLCIFAGKGNRKAGLSVNKKSGNSPAKLAYYAKKNFLRNGFAHIELRGPLGPEIQQ
jgi:hypothetical protein